ncbi:MAG TPA: type II secretion system secretin GspD [Bryobacteraceae bacterium]|nr:type II secretion system secretin GspD [Bryobacteraceae bacterium]
MVKPKCVQLAVSLTLSSVALWAQANPPQRTRTQEQQQLRTQQQQQLQQQQQQLQQLQQQQRQPQAQQQVAPAGQAGAPAATSVTRSVVPPAAPGTAPPLFLENASLVEVVDILARALKINYIIDPRVKGSVTINTYGEFKPVDVRPLLETILRINGAAMVQVGDMYRIVPVGDVSHLPLSPQVNATNLPEDERTVLNLIFLKYVTVGEMAKLIEPFLGEGAKMTVYDPANLLMILDNSRNMKRTVELVSLFDSDTLAGQRVRLFDVQHGRPTDIAKELDNVFKAFALSEKTSSIRFMPIDRINTIIAVAPNPGVFPEVEKWLRKLDVPMKVTAGSIDNYVYRLKYGSAQLVGMVIMQLYTGFMGFGGYGMGGYGMGGYGMGGYGMGGYGMGGSGMGGYGMGGYGMGGYGMGGSGMGGFAGGVGAGPNAFMTGMQPGMALPGSANPALAAVNPQSAAAAAGGTTTGEDLTGSYLGYGGYGALRHPRIIPNPFDNTLLIQGTPQEWEQISKLIQQIDIAPRQVLIEARVYEVDLTGSWSAGVEEQLKLKDGTYRNLLGSLTAAAGGNPALNLSAGLLVGHARQLLAFLNTSENTTRAKVISAPSVIATDSIPASITVGDEVPTISSTAVSGAQVGGTSLFANTVQNRSTGVGLNILARVNSSGVVTMVINQNVSAPIPPPAGVTVDSTSFSQRNVSTQVTVQDGDTIAIGGIIQESDTNSSAGTPVLHRIPFLGVAFGSKSVTKQRTELIVFLTPRVIYDTNQIADATDEVRSKLKGLEKMIRE